jgi:tripeptide aminopeptidase
VITVIDRDRLVQTFLDLVRIDSPSGEEDAMAEAIAQRLTALGAEVLHDTFGNLIARLGADGEPFLLSAHMDTVEPGRGIRPVIEGDTIRTDGSTILGGDPKAGIAAILEALTAVRAAGMPHRPVEVVFTRGEEAGLLGSRNLDYSLVSARRGVVLDGEGAVSEITNEAPAMYTVDVEVIGRAAHAGVEPEKGVPAILIAAELIVELPQGRIDRETTANIGLISGGTARNAVPERCSFKAEFRSRNPQRLAQVKQEIELAIAGVAARHPNARIEARIEKAFDGYRLSPQHPLLQLCATTLRTLGMEPHFVASGGATDANIFAAHGIEAAVLGMGGGSFHTTRETLSITNLVNSARFLAALLTSHAA